MAEKTVEQLLEEQNALLRDQNKLLAQTNATANGISFNEEMRGRARRWDSDNPVLRFFAINPFAKWR